MSNLVDLGFGYSWSDVVAWLHNSLNIQYIQFKIWWLNWKTTVRKITVSLKLMTAHYLTIQHHLKKQKKTNKQKQNKTPPPKKKNHCLTKHCNLPTRHNRSETWQSSYKIINFLLLCYRHSSDEDEQRWRHHTSCSWWYLCTLSMMGCIQCLHRVAPSKTFILNLYIHVVRQIKSYNIFATVVTNTCVLL